VGGGGGGRVWLGRKEGVGSGGGLVAQGRRQGYPAFLRVGLQVSRDEAVRGQLLGSYRYWTHVSSSSSS
jgi:hypothetical protein